jgi:hypothetical protein
MILQIATALAIGAYVVLSKDARPKNPDAISRESFQHSFTSTKRSTMPLLNGSVPTSWSTPTKAMERKSTATKRKPRLSWCFR